MVSEQVPLNVIFPLPFLQSTLPSRRILGWIHVGLRGGVLLEIFVDRTYPSKLDVLSELFYLLSVRSQYGHLWLFII